LKKEKLAPITSSKGKQNNLLEFRKRTKIVTLPGKVTKLHLAANILAKEGYKSGYMDKLGGVVKNWKARFFVLHPTGLYYYKSPMDNVAKGMISLKDATVYVNSEIDGILEIHTKRRVYCLIVTDQSLSFWVDAIKECVPGIQVVIHDIMSQ